LFLSSAALLRSSVAIGRDARTLNLLLEGGVYVYSGMGFAWFRRLDLAHFSSRQWGPIAGAAFSPAARRFLSGGLTNNKVATGIGEPFERTSIAWRTFQSIHSYRRGPACLTRQQSPTRWIGYHDTGCTDLPKLDSFGARTDQYRRWHAFCLLFCASSLHDCDGNFDRCLDTRVNVRFGTSARHRRSEH
jgi:hypothetical protein